MTRFLRGCYDALAAAGWLWLGLPMAPPPVSRPELRPPSHGHPERLRPDLPPSDAELALWRQLMEPARKR
ncbi:hypothetical protein GCM10010393_37740 [Streptomyces gobitricini]|uniref:Uncharacterized protein n=1 Tax=Streptomyces gobitricini TaxID=68211 RepID=A0ABP5ZPE1_9ACTN